MRLGADLHLHQVAIVLEEPRAGRKSWRSPHRAFRPSDGRADRGPDRTARVTRAASRARARSGSSPRHRAQRTLATAVSAVSARKPWPLIPTTSLSGATPARRPLFAIELGQRPKPRGLPANDRDRQRESERARRARPIAACRRRQSRRAKVVATRADRRPDRSAAPDADPSHVT